MEKELIFNEGQFTRLLCALVDTGPVSAELEKIQDAGIPKTPKEILATMAALKQMVEATKEAKAAAQNLWDTFSIGFVPEYMDEQELTNLAGEGGRIDLRNQLRVSTPREHKGQLFDWLRQNKLDQMITEGVNANTLKAFVKEAMTNGNPYPGELLKIEAYKQAVLVRK